MGPGMRVAIEGCMDIKLTETEAAQVAKLRKLIRKLARQDGTAAMHQANECRAAIASIHAGALARG